MPNWCANDLTIKGKPKMLNKLLKTIETTASEVSEARDTTMFDFNKIIPRPESENDNWYNWNTSNWGTKWNACDVGFITDGDWSETYDESSWESGELIIQFNTAWSPPVPVIEALSKQFPSVKITHKFTEEGMGFYGTYIYRKGMIEVEAQGEFTSDTPCDTFVEYYGEGHTHWCKECDEPYDCDNNPNWVCEDCVKEIADTDKELWEDTDETKTNEAPVSKGLLHNLRQAISNL